MPVLGLITVVPLSVQFNFELSGAVPAVQVVTVDVDSEDAGVGYSNLYIQAIVSAPWLQATFQTSPLISTPQQQFNVDYALIEAQANLLSTGDYNAVVSYQVIGTNDNTGIEDILMSSFHDVSLTVTNTTTISVIPTSIDFLHTIGDALPASKAVTPNGPNWKLETPVGFILTSATATITSDVDGNYTATGTGAMVVNIAPQSSILQTVGSQNYTATIKDASNVVQASVTIAVRVNADDTFEVTPNSFDFTSIKNVNNAVAQLLTINSAIAFTLTKPSWLNVSAASGINYIEIDVQPDAASGLDTGIYDGDIVISRTIDGSTVNTTIPVHYEIVDFIKLPGAQGDFWFTLDNKFMEVFTAKTNTYFQLTLTAILYDFYDVAQKTVVLPYKIPLFKNLQQFNIGKIIDRLMYRLNYDTLTSQQYKPAKIELLVEEKELGTNTVLQTILLSNISYVAGYTPEKIINTNCYLELYNHPSRVTKNSFYFLNYLLKTGNYTLKLFKNGGWVSDTAISAAADHHIYTRKLLFTNDEPGDVIQYQIEIDGEVLSKTFVVFPENKESYHIIWEDEYKLKTAMEFTGAFKIGNDLDNILQKSYQNDVEFTEKISVTTDGTFTATTGFILKVEQQRVESLMRSKKAWLVLPNESIINIVPTDKNLVNINSERELYSFEIKFTVNKDHDAQNYSF